MSQNIFSLEGLISWLEKQDPKEPYPHCSSDDCLLHRYFTARGLPLAKKYAVDSYHWQDKSGKAHEYPKELDYVAVPSPETYGAALQRARVFLAEQ